MSRGTKKSHGLLYYLNRCDAIVIVYIFSGESGTVTFRMKKYLINDVVDWFGKDAEFFDESEDEISARVYVNLTAMRCWAMQYARENGIRFEEKDKKRGEGYNGKKFALNKPTDY